MPLLPPNTLRHNRYGTLPRYIGRNETVSVQYILKYIIIIIIIIIIINVFYCKNITEDNKRRVNIDKSTGEVQSETVLQLNLRR